MMNHRQQIQKIKNINKKSNKLYIYDVSYLIRGTTRLIIKHKGKIQRKIIKNDLDLIFRSLTLNAH